MSGAPAAVEVVLALGTNLGDRAAALQGAVDLLRAAADVEVLAVSPVVETDPVGGPEQPDYLNAVVVVGTALAPDDLLALARRIEGELGRERRERWGARTLDMDVIAVGSPGSPSEVRCATDRLTLPHPRAHQRAFVLAPWLAVRPHALLRLPDGRVQDVAALLAGAADRDGVRPAPVELRR